MYKTDFNKISKQAKTEIKERMRHKHSRLPSETVEGQAAKTAAKTINLVPRPSIVTKTCQNPKCGKKFEGSRMHGKYCSLSCRKVMQRVRDKKKEEVKIETKKQVVFDNLLADMILSSYNPKKT